MFTQSRHTSRPVRHIGLFTRLRAVLALHRQRQHLLALDPHMLRDIGLTAAQAHAESTRPFWDAPPAWTHR